MTKAERKQQALIRRYMAQQEKRDNLTTVRLADSTIDYIDQLCALYGLSRATVVADMVGLGVTMWLDNHEYLQAVTAQRTA